MMQSMINQYGDFVFFFYKFVVGFALLIALMKLPTWVRGFRLGAKKKEFNCLLCGNCCRLRIIDLDEDDIARLKNACVGDFVDSNNFMARQWGRCVFLKDDKCTIHDHRPRVCREFPFQKIFGRWFLPPITFCPGVDRLVEDEPNSKTR